MWIEQWKKCAKVYRIFAWKLSITSIRCCIIFQQYTQYNDTTVFVNWPMEKMCIGVSDFYPKIIYNKHTLWNNLPTIHSIQRYNGLCELTNCFCLFLWKPKPRFHKFITKKSTNGIKLKEFMLFKILRQSMFLSNLKGLGCYNIYLFQLNLYYY